jgi:muramoyltetrapeptide carboxypeptidase LdcA involved in peptidoglycan recycling
MSGLLHRGDRVGLVACSNGLSEAGMAEVRRLIQVLRDLGLEPVCSPHLAAMQGPVSADGPSRARALEAMYTDTTIRAIFDVSGGDLANEVLSHLNFDLVAANDKPFFGYSDLTTILNAIYARTGRSGWLYSVRNLVGSTGKQRILNFSNTILHGTADLCRCRWQFVQGDTLDGIVVGGNIRCFLKLAGTPNFPDLTGKLLLLESGSGDAALITAFFHQLRQMGAFQQVAGVLLGTFLALDRQPDGPTAAQLLLPVLGADKIPVAATQDIGHRADSKALVIGQRLQLQAI